MRHDIIRVAVILLFSLFVGLVVGRVFLCMSIGLLVYIVWQLRITNNLLNWMRRGKFIKEPQTPGLIEAIARQYNDLKARHKKRKKQLSKYLKRFRETTQALPDAIVVLGEHDEIEWVNEKAEQYLGIYNNRDKGQRLINLIRHPDLVKFIKESDRSAEKTEMRLQLVSPVNKEMHLELRLVFFGKTDKLLMARDITKIYRINRMRKDFIANASHELRSPLTVISGYLESFEDELSADDSEQDTQRVLQMRKQTERMRQLIEDLLKLSSLETTEELGNTETVRIPGIVRNIVEEAMAISSHDSQTISLDLDENLWLEGDRNQIYSAISNIINNAVQHTPAGGKIWVRWFEQEGEGIFEVQDTGEGISSEHIPRITERFYRVDRGRSRQKGGTGLGLAIVKHILANHKSKLEIESKLGEGSLFRFRFPKSLIIHKDIIPDRITGEKEPVEN